MARSRIIVDLSSGGQSIVPYTAQEESAADAAKAADDVVQAPIIADQQRVAAIKANARTTAIVNALTTKDDVGLIAAVQNRYPSLAGDGLKAVTDIALALATIYRAS
jgi:hypothetical protein